MLKSENRFNGNIAQFYYLSSKVDSLKKPFCERHAITPFKFITGINITAAKLHNQENCSYGCDGFAIIYKRLEKRL